MYNDTSRFVKIYGLWNFSVTFKITLAKALPTDQVIEFAGWQYVTPVMLWQYLQQLFFLQQVRAHFFPPKPHQGLSSVHLLIFYSFIHWQILGKN